MRHERRVALLVAASVLAAAAPAWADDGRITKGSEQLIGLLDVRVEGVSDTAAGRFATQIEESLGVAGFQVASRQRLRSFLAASPWNAACLVGDCLSVLKTHAGIDRVVEASIVAVGPSYHYVISLIDTSSGLTLDQKAERCEVCTTEEAFAAAALAVVGLLHGVNSDGSPKVRRDSSPRRDRERARRSTRRMGIALLSGGAIAAAGSIYLFSRDEDNYAYGAAGAAGALAVAGITSLGISFSF